MIPVASLGIYTYKAVPCHFVSVLFATLNSLFRPFPLFNHPYTCHIHIHTTQELELQHGTCPTDTSYYMTARMYTERFVPYHDKTHFLHSISGDRRHERVVNLLHPRHLLELFLFLFAHNVIVSRHAIRWFHIWLVVEVTLDVKAHVRVRVEACSQIGEGHPAINVSKRWDPHDRKTHLSSSKRYHCGLASATKPIQKKKGKPPRPETAQNWYSDHCPSDLRD